MLVGPGVLRLLELTKDGIRETACRETEHFRITRDFLLGRERTLRELLAEEESDTSE